MIKNNSNKREKGELSIGSADVARNVKRKKRKKRTDR